MGTNISRNSPQFINLNQYQQLSPREENQNFRLIRNQQTGLQLQEYSLQFNQIQEFRQYYEAFKWRLNQPHIVNTAFFIDTSKNQFCSTAHFALVYIQRIPIRLSDIKDIPYPDNLYVLQTCFEGFNIIYQKTKYFEILQHMICINNDAKVKIWINGDLSKNYPQQTEIDDQKDQSDMVQRILQLIDSNTDHNSQPSKVIDYFSDQNQPTFSQARLILKQYAKSNNVKIPDRFQSILQHILGQEEQGQTEGNYYQQNQKGNSHYEDQRAGGGIKSSENLYSKNQKPQQNHSYFQNQNPQYIHNSQQQHLQNNHHIQHQQHFNQQQYPIYHQSQSQLQTQQLQLHQPQQNHQIIYHQPQIYHQIQNRQQIPSYNQNIYSHLHQIQSLKPQNVVNFNYQPQNQFVPPMRYHINQNNPIIVNPHIIQGQQHIYRPPISVPIIRQNNMMEYSHVRQAPSNYARQPQPRVIQHRQLVNNSEVNILQTRNNYQTQAVQPSNKNISQDQIYFQQRVNKSTQQEFKPKIKQMERRNHLQIQQHNNQNIQQQKNVIKANHTQNRYISRDVNIINQDFNKYYQLNQVNNVRNNKQQIVKSAKQMLQMREKQARKIQQQKIQHQQRLEMERSNQPIFYHSSEDYHELDPQIAQDLLNMGI